MIFLSWVAVFFQLFGCWLNARRNIWCFHAWNVGAACWIAYAIATDQPAMLVLNLVFAVFNIYGWSKWCRPKVESTMKYVAEDTYAPEEVLPEEVRNLEPRSFRPVDSPVMTIGPHHTIPVALEELNDAFLYTVNLRLEDGISSRSDDYVGLTKQDIKTVFYMKKFGSSYEKIRHALAEAEVQGKIRARENPSLLHYAGCFCYKKEVR